MICQIKIHTSMSDVVIVIFCYILLFMSALSIDVILNGKHACSIMCVFDNIFECI